MAQNESPSIDSFCFESNVPDSTPVIRFVGGGQLEAQSNPTQGQPTTCQLSLGLVEQMQPAFAAFQPFLDLLDAVATLAQCVLVLGEVPTNPSKIKDFLECVPALVAKINKLLGLVPQFPQGIQQFITMIVDVVRFVGQMLDCVVTILESLQGQFAELTRISDRIAETDDVEVRTGLQRLFDCGQEEAQAQANNAVSALGPIARILCLVRALLQLVPGGKEIQKLLALPGPGNVDAIEDSIAVLRLVRDALLLTEEALVNLTLGLGILPPPGPAFVCPLDDEPDEEGDPLPDPPTPVITSITNVDGSPLALAAGDPDTPILIAGIDLTSDLARPGGGNKVYLGASPLPESGFQSNAAGTTVIVTVPAGLLTVAGTFQVSVVNERADGAGTGPFEGLDGSSVGGDNNAGEGVFASDPFPIDVV